MKFSLFMYCTVGRRAELEAGMAGRRPELYQRMLDEIADYVRFADDAGYFGFGHPEHHLQIEGFEIALVERLCSEATADTAREVADKTWDLVHDRPDSDPVKRKVVECHEALARLHR